MRNRGECAVDISSCDWPNFKRKVTRSKAQKRLLSNSNHSRFSRKFQCSRFTWPCWNFLTKTEIMSTKLKRPWKYYIHPFVGGLLPELMEWLQGSWALNKKLNTFKMFVKSILVKNALRRTRGNIHKHCGKLNEWKPQNHRKNVSIWLLKYQQT